MSPITVDLAYRPRPWQQQCHERPERFQVFALHRRAGKTVMASMKLVDCALKTKRDMATFVYIAPYLRQAKAIAWAMLKARVEPLRRVGRVEINEGELTIRFPHNGAVIRLFGADNPDALRGMRLDGVVIDEVAQIAPYVWDEILQPALSDRLGWAVFIGTPHGVNLFSELFYKAQTAPGWFAGRWTVYDTGAIERSEVERLRSSGMSEAAFAREYLCDFTAAGDDQVISLTDVEDAARRKYHEREIAESPRILGVDPARFGDDRSVIVRRQGLQMFNPDIFRGIDNMALASRVAGVITQWKPHATFIDAGAGSGVIDRLRQLGFTVVEVPFGGRALKPHLYGNRRSEMWIEGVAQWIVGGGAIPNIPELKQELATPTYHFDAQERRVMESKDDTKKRLQGGASPDIGDGLALTFAAPVGIEVAGDVDIAAPTTHRYDPIGRYDIDQGHDSASSRYDPMDRWDRR